MNAIMNRLSPSVTDMIRMDHTHVQWAFHRYEPDASPRSRQAIVNTVCLEIEIHAQLEEEIFYPAMRAFVAENPLLEKSFSDHHEMRRLVVELRGMDPMNPAYSRAFMDLMRDVLHHAADEETLLLPEAERLLGERLGELGAQMTKRRLQLAAPHASEIAVNTVRAFPAMSVLLGAGALVAGTYLFRRSLSRTA
jgi:hemerythrin superfamily protein